jgi:hypothetical protein
MWARAFAFGLFAYAGLIAVTLFGIYVLGHLEGALGGRTENFIVDAIASVPMAIILASGFALSGLHRRTREAVRQSRLWRSVLAGAIASVLLIGIFFAADALFAVEGNRTVGSDDWWLVDLIDWISFVSGVGAALFIGAAAGFALAAAIRHKSHAA